MARNKKEVAVASHELDSEQTPGLEVAAQAANQMAVLQHQYNEERDLANQVLGQIQMGISISKFTTVVSLSKLKQIRKASCIRL